jgi:heavy-metal exporter, HME family
MLRLNPGVTLAESVRIGSAGRTLLLQVPEVEHIGRRTGRAELDEHAEGVHVSASSNCRLKPGGRSKDELTPTSARA